MGVFIVATITDWFDGYWARRFKEETPLGKFLDPVADKLFFGTAIVVLIIKYQLPLYYFLALSRDAVISVVGLYIFFKAKKKKPDFTSSKWGKATTVAQGLAIFSVMLHLFGIGITTGLIDFLILVTFILGVISIWSYVGNWMKKGYI